LDLAAFFGWEPEGTQWNAEFYAAQYGEDADGQAAEEWAGGYLSNDFQSVTGSDARHLLEALERALLFEQEPAVIVAAALARASDANLLGDLEMPAGCGVEFPERMVDALGYLTDAGRRVYLRPLA
jgi:hypothetical protein